MNPKISVIIRSKDEERFIGETLRTLFDQRCDWPFEVLVIDSGSRDRTLDIVKRFPVTISQIPPESFTFGGALNFGAKEARGDTLINLSAHCIPIDRHWLQTLVEPLTGHDSIAATFGCHKPIMGLNPFEEKDLLACFEPDRVRAIFSNSNCAIRKSVWEIHPFDAHIPYAEDFLWAKTLPPQYRIKYLHSAAVYHTHPLSLRYWAKRYYSLGLSRVYTNRAFGLGEQREKAPPMGLAATARRHIKHYWAELRDTMSFLVRSGYYRHALIAPLFVLFRNFHIERGRVVGRSRYRDVTPMLSAVGQNIGL